MRAAIIVSREGRAAPLARRLEEEGVETYFYVHEPEFKDVSEGMLSNRVSLEDLAKILEGELEDGTATVICDGFKVPQVESEADLAWLRTVAKLKDPEKTQARDLFGDALGKHCARREWRLMGSSGFAAGLRQDFARQMRTAQTLGLKTLPAQPYSTLSDLLSFLERNRNERWELVVADCDHPVTYREGFQGELIEMLQARLHAESIASGRVFIRPSIEGFEYEESAWWIGGVETASIWTLEGHGAPRQTLTGMASPRRMRTPWTEAKRAFGQLNYEGPIGFRFRVQPNGDALCTGMGLGFERDMIYRWLSLTTTPAVRWLSEGLGGYRDESYAAMLECVCRCYDESPPVAGERGFAFMPGVKEDKLGRIVCCTPNPILAYEPEGIDVAMPHEVFERAQERARQTRVVGGLVVNNDWREVCERWKRLKGMGYVSP